MVPLSLTRRAPGGCGGCFLIQNGDLGLPRSTTPLIFDVLGRCQKIMIFGRLPDDPKNRKNRSVERQGVQKVTSSIRKCEVSEREGSPGIIEIGPFDH